MSSKGTPFRNFGCPCLTCKTQDPNIIAILHDTGHDLTKRALQLDHNRDRYQAPTADTTPSSGPNTPSTAEDYEDAEVDANTRHRVTLSFNRPPKDVKLGYVFGWGSDCDIQLVDKDNYLPGDHKQVAKVSRRHFSITFDAQRRVILRDTSRHGTSVSYDGQARNEIRKHFTWIIFQDCKNIEVSIPHTEILLTIKLENHEDCKDSFFTNVDMVFPPTVRLGGGGLATPMQQLNVISQATSVATSGTATPGRGPIYIQHEPLGSGSFGQVFKVTDVSTGEHYAGKFIDSSDCTREVAIMRASDHAHVVRFVDHIPEPRPLIVMEYLPLGSLEGVLRSSKTTVYGTVTILSQLLKGVAYLNSIGVVHRDIKPANILLSCQDPVDVKLADFGLAKNDRNGYTCFKTRAGTDLYVAPEIDERDWHTHAVDIWSLGVVALELAYGLPYHPPGRFDREEWHRKILERVRSQRPKRLADFLSRSMLCAQPEDRLSARDCLEKVDTIKRTLDIEKAFKPKPTREASQAGSATPTQNASALTTILRGSNSKRPRSPESSWQAVSSKKTAIWKERDSHNALAYSQTYAIANASLWFGRSRDPVYDSVLSLLTDLQVDHDEATDSCTVALVQSLCQRLKQLQIVEIAKWTDRATERTILTAVGGPIEFRLASLTASDLADSVAGLAQRLQHALRPLAPDLETGVDGHASRLCQEEEEEGRDMPSWFSPLRDFEPVQDEPPAGGGTTPTQASVSRVDETRSSWRNFVRDVYSVGGETPAGGGATPQRASSFRVDGSWWKLLRDFNRAADEMPAGGATTPQRAGSSLRMDRSWRNLQRDLNRVEDETPAGGQTALQQTSATRVDGTRRSWSPDRTDSWRSCPARGWTYPSATSEPINGSGCTVAS